MYAPQPEPFTRHATRDGHVVSVSRIGRIHTNVFTGDLLGLKPSSGTSWNMCRADFPSDHVPVYIRLNGGGGNRARSVPSWVSRHPLCPILLGKLIDEHGVREDSPPMLIEELNCPMHEAGRLVQHRLSELPPENAEQHLQWQ